MSNFNQWFFKPSSPRVFTFFRIAVALFCMVQIIKLYPDLLNIFGQYGFNRADVVAVTQAPFMPRITWVSDALAHWGIGEIQVIYGLFVFYLVLLLGLALGYVPRLFAALSLLCHLLFFGSGKMFMYGVDYFTTSALFYCMISPSTQAFSLRKLRFLGQVSYSSYATFFKRVLQIHLCLVYFFGGFSKMLGTHWWTGEGIWRAVSLPGFNNLNTTWMADFPMMLMVMGWGVLIMETFYFVLIYFKKTRPLTLLIIMSMHLGIALSMGLYQFALIMILFNFTAFGWDTTKEVLTYNRFRKWNIRFRKILPSFGEKPLNLDENHLHTTNTG